MLSRYDPVKRLALVACLVHTARMRGRDDLAETPCKRVAANVKLAGAELEEIRLRQRAVCERLIGTDPHRCADGCGRSTSWAVAGLAVRCCWAWWSLLCIAAWRSRCSRCSRSMSSWVGFLPW